VNDDYPEDREIIRSTLKQEVHNPPRVLHGSCQRVLPIDLVTRPNNSEDTNDIYH
jgi:hypothetical protein